MIGMILWAISRFLILTVFRILYKVKFEGLENIPKKGGYIYASNHRSNADPVFVAVKVRIPFAYMAKKELFEGNKFFKWLITVFGAYPLERGIGDRSAVDEGIKRIRAGKNFMIFPEGTRSKDGKVGRGKTGIAIIAAEAKTQIIPIGISYEGELKFRTKVTVRYGKPINITNIVTTVPPVKSELKELVNVIMAEIEKLVYA